PAPGPGRPGSRRNRAGCGGLVGHDLSVISPASGSARPPGRVVYCPWPTPAAGGTPMKSVHIDRAKRLKDQPTTGHNRFHPEVPPIVVAEEGEEVVLETRDGVDGQLGPATTEADMAIMQPGAIHPLTGPVLVKGAQPGDVLEVEFLDIVPQPHAFTAIVPGLGFLRDLFTTPF